MCQWLLVHVCSVFIVLLPGPFPSFQSRGPGTGRHVIERKGPEHLTGHKSEVVITAHKLQETHNLGEPERAPNTRVTYGEFTVPMYVCMYIVCVCVCV